MKSKKVLLLGASGSIGRQTIDVIRESNGKFVLTGFSVGNKTEFVSELLKEFKEVKWVYVISETIAKEFSEEYPNVSFFAGADGLETITKVADYDMCVDALVGFAGMVPAVRSLERNKILCLANKEALVTGGTLINNLLKQGKGRLYPIDSEHVALAKCLAKCDRKDVKRLIITASGGALRNIPLENLNDMKAADALKHPTWRMGNKITIDCATMMNKGFEIIEAYYLYGFGLDRISVQMHDESLVHSAVELNDGTLIIDYGKPDMHNPIRWALYEGKAFGDIIKVKSFDELKECHFHEYDARRYPCTEFAKQALREGATKMVALNAANEVLVNKYLRDEIKFLDIAKGVEKTLSKTPINKSPTLEEIIALDKQIREETK